MRFVLATQNLVNSYNPKHRSTKMLISVYIGIRAARICVYTGVGSVLLVRIRGQYQSLE